MAGKVIIGDISSKLVARVIEHGLLLTADKERERLEAGESYHAHHTAADITTTSAVDYLLRTSGKAYAFLTLGDNPTEDETITIGSTVYTFKASPSAPYDVDIGANASGTVDNLIAAITFDGGAGTGEGTTYGTGTVAHPDVTATPWAGDVLKATALAVGTAGNLIALAADGDSAWTDEAGGSAATFLAGGTAGKHIHLHLRGIGSAGPLRVQIYEGPTIDDDGTAVPIHCRNRVTPQTAETVLEYAPSSSDDGTLIANRLLPTIIGGKMESYILDEGAEYLVRVTNEHSGTQDLETSFILWEDDD